MSRLEAWLDKLDERQFYEEVYHVSNESYNRE
jgi:hypothetical protein